MSRIYRLTGPAAIARSQGTMGLGGSKPLDLAPREAAAFFSISKRSLSRLIRAGRIEARKAGPRTLVDVASLRAYYDLLPKKADHLRIVFGRRAYVLPRARAQVRH